MYLFTSRIKSRISVSKFEISNHIIALISGVISGFLGALAGGFTFITTFNYLTYYLYSNRQYADWDYRKKNFFIYLGSDFTASISKIFLETRKQLI